MSDEDYDDYETYDDADTYDDDTNDDDTALDYTEAEQEAYGFANDEELGESYGVHPYDDDFQETVDAIKDAFDERSDGERNASGQRGPVSKKIPDVKTGIVDNVASFDVLRGRNINQTHLPLPPPPTHISNHFNHSSTRMSHHDVKDTDNHDDDGIRDHRASVRDPNTRAPLVWHYRQAPPKFEKNSSPIRQSPNPVYLSNVLFMEKKKWGTSDRGKNPINSSQRWGPCAELYSLFEIVMVCGPLKDDGAARHNPSQIDGSPIPLPTLFVHGRQMLAQSIRANVGLNHTLPSSNSRTTHPGIRLVFAARLGQIHELEDIYGAPKCQVCLSIEDLDPFSRLVLARPGGK
ncbi:hypothetical protein BDK51DRAFT_26832 [Blyttiomyces helicus]|uniref:Uncharacterized protein n=1 Tax=Blyttiomyces helicus TaxID=388810 RepID=A0A4P9W7V1_9FUNG|nr:hypothetical protein BDK51DRAFT_26832 [Blyttiomyces helicus]|eukprot:RKO87483.1 hypothetical protein BDK51DRAFT_26832 [Blyttiomyces helicus]